MGTAGSHALHRGRDGIRAVGDLAGANPRRGGQRDGRAGGRGAAPGASCKRFHSAQVSEDFGAWWPSLSGRMYGQRSLRPGVTEPGKGVSLGSGGTLWCLVFMCVFVTKYGPSRWHLRDLNASDVLT